MGKIPVIHSAVVRLVWLHFETFPTNEQFVTLVFKAILLSIPGQIHGTSNQYKYLPLSFHRIFFSWRKKLSDIEEFTLLLLKKGESPTLDNHQSLKRNQWSMKIPILRNPKTLEMYVLRIEQSLVGRASVSWARDLARATPATLGWSAQQSPAAVTAVTMQTHRCYCHLHCVLMGQCLKWKS